MKAVAFIGLGLMGRLMSANVARGGFAVRSYDIDGSGSMVTRTSAPSAASRADAQLPEPLMS